MVKPWPASSYAAASSAHSRSIIAVGCSSSWASSSAGTGSMATRTIASIARTVSASGVPGIRCCSISLSVIVVYQGTDRHRLAPTGPLDLDVAEPLALVQLDEILLEQLEHGEEADDHLQPVD